MATEAITRKRSYKAAGDLSLKQFYAVYLSDDKTVDTCNGFSKYPIGVQINAPAVAGQAVEVVVGGVTQAILGGTVVAGDRLFVNASGKFQKVIPGWGYCAIAEEGGVVNDIRSIMFLSGAVVAAPVSP